jgi:ABC-type transporter MlaC component
MSSGGAFAESQQQAIYAQFSNLFTLITQQLSTDQPRYQSDPRAYGEFIDVRIRSSWDVTSTTSALIGKARFASLKSDDRQALVAAVDRSLVRYAFMGLDYYNGQIFKVVDLVVNQEAGLGWVQILMESPVIPDINLDLLIKRTSSGVWKAVDIRFKGITYVSIKKHEYREILEKRGVQALIALLEKDNSTYFDKLCAKSLAKLEGVPPC